MGRAGSDLCKVEKTMIGPVSRIIARYIASALVTYGMFAAPDAAMIEPDIALMVGAVVGAAVEGAYAIAIRKGWTT